MFSEAWQHFPYLSSPSQPNPQPNPQHLTLTPYLACLPPHTRVQCDQKKRIFYIRTYDRFCRKLKGIVLYQLTYLYLPDYLPSMTTWYRNITTCSTTYLHEADPELDYTGLKYWKY